MVLSTLISSIFLQIPNNNRIFDNLYLHFNAQKRSQAQYLRPFYYFRFLLISSFTAERTRSISSSLKAQRSKVISAELVGNVIKAILFIILKIYMLNKRLDFFTSLLQITALPIRKYFLYSGQVELFLVCLHCKR